MVSSLIFILSIFFLTACSSNQMSCNSNLARDLLLRLAEKPVKKEFILSELQKADISLAMAYKRGDFNATKLSPSKKIQYQEILEKYDREGPSPVVISIEELRYDKDSDTLYCRAEIGAQYENALKKIETIFYNISMNDSALYIIKASLNGVFYSLTEDGVLSIEKDGKKSNIQSSLEN